MSKSPTSNTNTAVINISAPQPSQFHQCHSPQLGGQLSIHCTPAFVYIYQGSRPEGDRLSRVGWDQIRRIALMRLTSDRSRACTSYLLVHFHQGRLPERMVRLMLDDHRLRLFASEPQGEGVEGVLKDSLDPMAVLHRDMIKAGGLVRCEPKSKSDGNGLVKWLQYFATFGGGGGDSNSSNSGSSSITPIYYEPPPPQPQAQPSAQDICPPPHQDLKETITPSTSKVVKKVRFENISTTNSSSSDSDTDSDTENSENWI